eukprot:Rhum_TRINITY_DN15122_c1_g1::Rhum_TRINITY_DN15122_c1_g1_i1::g.139205::m.139205
MRRRSVADCTASVRRSTSWRSMSSPISPSCSLRLSISFCESFCDSTISSFLMWMRSCDSPLRIASSSSFSRRTSSRFRVFSSFSSSFSMSSVVTRDSSASPAARCCCSWCSVSRFFSSTSSSWSCRRAVSDFSIALYCFASSPSRSHSIRLRRSFCVASCTAAWRACTSRVCACTSRARSASCASSDDVSACASASCLSFSASSAACAAAWSPSSACPRIFTSLRSSRRPSASCTAAFSRSCASLKSRSSSSRAARSPSITSAISRRSAANVAASASRARCAACCSAFRRSPAFCVSPSSLSSMRRSSCSVFTVNFSDDSSDSRAVFSAVRCAARACRSSTSRDAACSISRFCSCSADTWPCSAATSRFTSCISQSRSDRAAAFSFASRCSDSMRRFCFCLNCATSSCSPRRRSAMTSSFSFRRRSFAPSSSRASLYACARRSTSRWLLTQSSATAEMTLRWCGVIEPTSMRCTSPMLMTTSSSDMSESWGATDYQ